MKCTWSNTWKFLEVKENIISKKSVGSEHHFYPILLFFFVEMKFCFHFQKNYKCWIKLETLDTNSRSSAFQKIYNDWIRPTLPKSRTKWTGLYLPASCSCFQWCQTSNDQWYHQVHFYTPPWPSNEKAILYLKVQRPLFKINWQGYFFGLWVISLVV